MNKESGFFPFDSSYYAYGQWEKANAFSDMKVNENAINLEAYLIPSFADTRTRGQMFFNLGSITLTFFHLH